MDVSARWLVGQFHDVLLYILLAVETEKWLIRRWRSRQHQRRVSGSPTP